MCSARMVYSNFGPSPRVTSEGEPDSFCLYLRTFFTEMNRDRLWFMQCAVDAKVKGGKGEWGGICKSFKSAAASRPGDNWQLCSTTAVDYAH